ncbi:transketolase [Candidatus Kaiserbacteria bacterium RIFCSPHIGHO2_02_FULL_54_22]|uniref:Transketolase n=1 Tax=Candidatus Kaiserbacteria bacterium RIFCSPHIGHO2_02_FULL_54_22 TaxID=1798495 RepID=A0A1F6DMU8_9BACT|nr:MAG: transketolase [Candidatus Kaiserbacteria bacterium RIFCSPHIGHO2_02_FULL_54_22]OGG67867.1 MAG: transketolase [Candidatus Kaiserbacteria bacterium RIFCSPHIGHO2_12_FULL_54_16]OGG90029.1 MAG: transketolase [Candidatus Kaiserbacteria bacterium RIFCSPLOWO2_12_FULL_54_10]
MLNKNAKLSAKVFADDIEKAPTRDGFGKGTVEAGKADPRIVVLCADLAESTRAEWFQKEFPERFIEMGVAEQNMATVAAGMALAGKIPFTASYAAFNPGRNYEQIRTTIALNNVSVKICGMHAGVSVGPDGATHQMLEDIGLMRMLPNMIVLTPGDAEEARKAVIAATATDGPVYIRFGRAATPVFTTPESPFRIGKALLLWESENPKIAILSTGSLSHTALVAARNLSEKGIETLVFHLPTVKPLDGEAVIDAAKRTGAVVTIEEHQAAGGFGSAVAEFLAEEHPVPLKRLGIQDQFGQSGSPEELLSHYGLDAMHIEEAVRAFVAK